MGDRLEPARTEEMEDIRLNNNKQVICVLRALGDTTDGAKDPHIQDVRNNQVISTMDSKQEVYKRITKLSNSARTYPYLQSSCAAAARSGSL